MARVKADQVCLGFSTGLDGYGCFNCRRGGRGRRRSRRRSCFRFLTGLDLHGAVSLLPLAEDVRLTASVTLTGTTLELDAATGSVGLRRLVFGASAVAETRAHAEEVLARVVSLDGSFQPEEGMVFHGTLPQVFGRLLVVKPIVRIIEHGNGYAIEIKAN